jgi:EpsI family protein
MVILAGAFLLTSNDRLLGGARRPPAAESSSDPDSSPRESAIRSAATWRWLLLGALLLALALIPFVIPAHQNPNLSRPSLEASIPSKLGSWQGVDLPRDDRFLGSVVFGDELNRHYRRKRGAPIKLFIGVDDRRNRGAGLVSAKTQHPGFGWRIVERTPLDPPPDGGHHELLLQRAPHGIALVYYRTDGIASPGVEITRALLALDQSFLRREKSARILRISTPVIDTSVGQRHAQARLKHFAERLARADAVGSQSERTSRAASISSR